MRVLALSPVVPWPLDTGGRIRTAKLLEFLAPHARVDLWAVRQPGLAAGVPRELARVCADVRVFERSRAARTSRLTRTRPELWFHSADLVRALGQVDLAASYDLIHVDEPCVLRALPRHLALPVVVHHHKLDTLLHARLSSRASPRARFEAYQLARLEREAARRTRHHVLASPEDARRLAERFAGLDLCVVPSGFDADYFALRGESPRERERLLFLGTLDYPPNVDGLEWFVREVLPRLRARRPRLLLEVVGRDPARRVRRLAGEHVRVLGPVADVRPYLERASCLVAALRIGGGTRLKVVEALALACPVVATSCAAEGLDLEHERHLLRADDAPGFARAVLGLLDDPPRAARLARAGRERVLRDYTWDLLAARLAEAWRGAAGAPSDDRRDVATAPRRSPAALPAVRAAQPGARALPDPAGRAAAPAAGRSRSA